MYINIKNNRINFNNVDSYKKFIEDNNYFICIMWHKTYTNIKCDDLEECDKIISILDDINIIRYIE